MPQMSWLEKVGIRFAPRELRFYDTNLSDRIEHAFHALALDEHRPPFSPALWERKFQNKQTTDLRQVWFPGNHGNVGGGWSDQGCATLSLAWMMDQMASIGCEFQEKAIDRIFTRDRQFYKMMAGLDKEQMAAAAAAKKTASNVAPTSPAGYALNFITGYLPWAASLEEELVEPSRPWGTEAVLRTETWLYKFAGYAKRTPGMYRKVDQFDGRQLQTYLEDTNERVHSAVRIRLEAGQRAAAEEGTGELWTAPALTENWRLFRTTEAYHDPVQHHQPAWGKFWRKKPAAKAGDADEEEKQQEKEFVAAQTTLAGDGTKIHHPEGEANAMDRVHAVCGPDDRWIWKYVGPEATAPKERIMVEEPLGPYERRLLSLAAEYKAPDPEAAVPDATIDALVATEPEATATPGQ